MATVSQPESLQLVIDQVGAWRVFSAAAQHAVARVFGKRGRFYELLGEAIAAIDGYTGTMPPYERAIVLAPRDPDGVCATITAVTGVACAIVDANDLEKAKVLGASPASIARCVEQALLDNPHGNGDEQTPIVVLKWRYGAGPSTCDSAAGSSFALITGFDRAARCCGSSSCVSTPTKTRHRRIRRRPARRRWAASCLSCRSSCRVSARCAMRSTLPLSFLIVACGAIGMLDDLLGITRGRNKGLRARTKLLRDRAGRDHLPALDRCDDGDLSARRALSCRQLHRSIAPHWLWLLLGSSPLPARSTRSTSPTGSTAWRRARCPPLLVFARWRRRRSRTWPKMRRRSDRRVPRVSVLQPPSGKDVHGRHRLARTWCVLSGVAILDGEMLLLIVIGGVFVAETLSVILQVSYFKPTGGKRIFACARCTTTSNWAAGPRPKSRRAFGPLHSCSPLSDGFSYDDDL